MTEQTPTAPNETVRETVARLLSEIREGGESTATQLARRFDGWDGPIVVSRDEIERARASLPQAVIEDIRAAHRGIHDFARAQLETLREFEVELLPGLVAGHRLIPVDVAGCYVPAGRFAHIASALMSATTAQVAAVPTIIVASPATAERGGVHPAVIVAADLAGATTILGLGGVQAIGALAGGLFTGRPADIIVGPGNAYVAEAKRQLFGQVGIDVIAGPTESMIVADHTADPELVAIDLVSQAEHGPDTPVWLVTTSPDVAERVAARVPVLVADLPEPGRISAELAWRDHGEITVVDSREAAADACNERAPEHLQVMADDLDWWHTALRNYGSLFLGEETTVTFGDKCAGPNHILPTGRGARYSGGLNVLSFVKQLTWQRMTPEAARRLGELAGRISRYEGMEGHARAADARCSGRPPVGEDPSLSGTDPQY